MFNLHQDQVSAPEELLETLQLLLGSRLLDGEVYTEYQLIQWLKQPDPGVFQKDSLGDALTLFRCHFLVMHCLYRLRLQWLAEQAGWLKIEPLSMQLLPWEASTSSDNQHVCESDNLARYYLDLGNLHTDRDTVEQLLRGIWQQTQTPAQRRDDLALLELTDPASEEDIRRQYRRLAMRHHPDRGGEVSHFQALLAAYQRLTL
ncbi:DNA-J related domain-containing protein [Parathalassolituus penaei]|uniref:DnaJ domain-containing protein n=1 Tax=Parathalassolituus penaei TaxID=2997323 RepID=A0A9X3EFU0_9GAMM|nr:DNA-J related domain-containing protein [Parathalassolituus penaei]MCY0963586.1 DnaJ domain-containing protein [Parathalassolituus penaei]